MTESNAMRSLLFILLSFLFLLPVSALAQNPSQNVTIEYTDGERQVREGLSYDEATDRFQVHCTGDHSGVALPSGYPFYHSDHGLIDKPEER